MTSLSINKVSSKDLLQFISLFSVRVLNLSTSTLVSDSMKAEVTVSVTANLLCPSAGENVEQGLQQRLGSWSLVDELHEILQLPPGSVKHPGQVV